MGLFNIDLPEDVHKKLKMLSVAKGETMERLVIDLISKKVEVDSIWGKFIDEKKK